MPQAVLALGSLPICFLPLQRGEDTVAEDAAGSKPSSLSGHGCTWYILVSKARNQMRLSYRPWSVGTILALYGPEHTQGSQLD